MTGPFPDRSDHDGGFTLLELLVALVVFGIVLAGLTQGTRSGLTLFQRQRAVLSTSGQLAETDQLLRHIIEEAEPGSQDDTHTLTGTAHAIALRGHVPTGIAPSALARLSDLRLSLEGHDLVLTWLAHRHAIALAPRPPPRQAVLMPGVSGWRSATLPMGSGLPHGARTSCPILCASASSRPMNRTGTGRTSSFRPCAPAMTENGFEGTGRFHATTGIPFPFHALASATRIVSRHHGHHDGRNILIVRIMPVIARWSVSSPLPSCPFRRRTAWRVTPP
ncbi:prepilin-type N-terminal cleavage/methylation domain-containing protein [Komagataeibacter kakiaceti]|uniref:prepilin-type N-terminal cleavage/methylation domain-containing protein n=1 Tax=Komagataeibacter kakiaceti TaxID=943261 RepID=UPI0009FC733E|nr:prepilin-type N-terminal cleavage/methylation domain-containing protein [Komagataeibacter kakiaceti]